jgi:hypothetical protein
MVVSSQSGGWSRVRNLASLAVVALLAVACQTPEPVVVNATFSPAPEFASRSPSQVAVLAVEDGTADADKPERRAGRMLTFFRQEVIRQLPSRLFTPITAAAVDSALASVAKPAAGQSIVQPATLQKLAGHAGEDAVFALRVSGWDETNLPVDKTVWFQFEAVLLGSDGTVLWSGQINGKVKAGGAGPSPRDRDSAARSCADLAVREMLSRLPVCTR